MYSSYNLYLSIYFNIIAILCLITLLIIAINLHRFKTRFKEMSRNNSRELFSCLEYLEEIKHYSYLSIAEPAVKDNIIEIMGVKFYVPMYRWDYVQSHIVGYRSFYEFDLLTKIDRCLTDKAIIFDMGANIGNHSLYWSLKRNAEKIHAFEPMDSTFNILSKNMEINNIGNEVVLNHLGLGDRSGKASVLSYTPYNIGGTEIQMDVNGAMNVITLDEYVRDSNKFREDRIDLFKIDVEGFEDRLLRGAEYTLGKYKPLIWVEIWEFNFEKVDAILKEYGYALKEKLNITNYLYEWRNGDK